MKVIRRLLPIAVLIALFLLAYFLGLKHYISFEYLRLHRKMLMSWVENYPIISPLIYIFCYILLVAISFPGASLLTIFGGFLFDQILGTIYAVVGASLGACMLFLAARYALGGTLHEKLGKTFEKIEKGFKKNGYSYLLFLRLIPIFPFWMVNIAPAALQVTLFTYFWTTIVGIIPGTFVYAQAGAGLAAIFDENREFSLQGVFNWEVRIALILLALLAILPIFVKKWIKPNAR